MDENKNWKTDSEDVSLSKMASSLYKMQLGINSIRDELRLLVDLMREKEGKDQLERRYDG